MSLVPGLDSTAECHVDARSVKCTANNPIPKPLGLNQRATAGGDSDYQQMLYRVAPDTGRDAVNGAGLSAMGTRISLWGRVTSVDSGSHSFWMDDGSILKSTVGNDERTGIRVIYDDTTATLPTVNAYVPFTPGVNPTIYNATGVLGAEMDDNDCPVPVLRVPKPPSVPTGIVYVMWNATGNNSGTSWTNAATTLEHGLEVADAGDEIWVADGTYTGNFTIDQSIALYGGFAGDEENREERDWAMNETILDGEDTGIVITVTGTNSPTTRIDGFTVQNGVGEEPEGAGGITCLSGEIMIANNKFLSNTGYLGGAVRCENGVAVVFSNTFGAPDDAEHLYSNNGRRGHSISFWWCEAGSLIAGNTFQYEGWDYGWPLIFAMDSMVDVVGNSMTDSFSGGIGFYKDTGSGCSGVIANNLIRNCIWDAVWCQTCPSLEIGGNVIDCDNSVYALGIYCDDCPELTIRDNTIHNVYGSPGIYVSNGSPIITGNTLADNGSPARPGNAIDCLYCAGPQIEANIFERNVGAWGGAISLQDVTDAAIKNNLFVHNRASGGGYFHGGGAIYSRDSSATIANNTFVENLVGEGTLTESGWTNVTLAAYGGAVHVTNINASTGRVTLVNNIFSGNQALQGNSVASTWYGLADVNYCGAWPDDDPPDRVNYLAEAGSECTLGSGLLYLEPLFSDAATGNYWLQLSSPLRSQGTYLSYNTVDITGKPRPGAGGVDMGAYESDPNNY